MKCLRTSRTLATRCLSVAALVATMALAGGWAHVPAGDDSDPLFPTITIPHRDYAMHTHRYFTFEAQSVLAASAR